MNITIQKNSLRLDTFNYTLTDIQAEIDEDINILVSLGCNDLKKKSITAKYGTQLKCYGSTRKTNGKYAISINEQYLRVGDPKDVHNTIMHEVIHCVDGCMNHGDKWKRIAAQVNSRFDFTPIQRTGDDKAYDAFLETKYKYKITCNKCGHEYKYLRKTKTFDECKCGKRMCGVCRSTDFTCEEI